MRLCQPALAVIAVMIVVLPPLGRILSLEGAIGQMRERVRESNAFLIAVSELAWWVGMNQELEGKKAKKRRSMAEIWVCERETQFGFPRFACHHLISGYGEGLGRIRQF